MTRTVTAQFPPLPVGELVSAIKRFPLDSLQSQLELISRLVRVHPLLNMDWGGEWRYRRARKLGDSEYPNKVQDLLWRIDKTPDVGRANPEGFSILYLADRPETAFSEIRVETASVLLADLKIRPGKKINVYPVGEFVQIQRTGRGYLSGDVSNTISNMLNACDPEEAKSLLITDAFLYDCLISDDEGYTKSSWVAKCIFDKNENCSAIAYSSARQRGAINFAVRTESFWDSWGISSARRMDVKHLALGYYDVSNIQHVVGITCGGELHWNKELDVTNSLVLLEPLWTP